MTGDSLRAEELAVRMGELLAVAEGAAPPSRVDPALAVRQGRARRRRTRTVVASVLAVAVASGSFALLQGGGGSKPPAMEVPPAPSLTPSPTSTSSPLPLPSAGATQTSSAVPTAGRAVLTVGARFGWLPDEVTVVDYRAETGGATVVARSGREGNLSDAAPAFITLKAFPVGVTPELGDFPTGAHGTRVEAPPVNGQEAYWLSADDPAYAVHLVVLRFRAPDGRWLQVDDSGESGIEQRKEVVRRIAGSVVPGDYTPPMPLSLSALPPQAAVSGVHLALPVKGGEGWSASINFQERTEHFLQVSVAPYPPAGSTSASPPPGEGQVGEGRCETGDGLRWCVSSMQPPQGEVGDPAAWLARVVGHGADRSAWTTDVLP